MEFGELFENPRVLLIIPFLLPFLFWAGRQWGLVVTSVQAYRKVSKLRAVIFFRIPFWCVYAVLVLAVVALASPQSKKLEAKTYAYGYRAGIAIDNSASMMGERIAAAKKAAADFIQRRPKDVFSFVAFDTTAVMASGLKFTTDHALVIAALNRLDGGGSSTAIGDGYLGELTFLINDVIPQDPVSGKKAYAVDFDRLKAVCAADKDSPEYSEREALVRKVGRIEGAFITAVTDGENNDGINPVAAVECAAGFDVPIFLISVGTAQDKELVRALERSGGGFFFATDEKAIQLMFDKIDALKPVRIVKGWVTIHVSYRPYLAAAIACFLLTAAILWAVSLKIR